MLGNWVETEATRAVKEGNICARWKAAGLNKRERGSYVRHAHSMPCGLLCYSLALPVVGQMCTSAIRPAKRVLQKSRIIPDQPVAS